MHVRLAAAWIAVVAVSLFVLPPTRAAAAAKPSAAAGDLIGWWSIEGPGIDAGTMKMEFAAPNELHVFTVMPSRNGPATSRGLGPDWKLAGNKITFNGSMQQNDFEIKGSWTLAWDGPDKVTATAGKGKKYQLARTTPPPADAPAGKATNPPTNPPAAKPAVAAKPAAVGDIHGIWTVTGPGVGSGKLTMQFAGRNELIVVRLTTADQGTLSTGPQWKLAGQKLTFADSLEEGKFEVAGTWDLAWDGPDQITATTSKGKTYHLARKGADKPEDKPAGTPAAGGAAKPGVAGDLVGAWTITGPGLDGFKATLAFAKPDTVTLVRVNTAAKGADARSQATGPTWKLTGTTIAFRGTLAADEFRIKGDWDLAWDGPDKFSATTGRGKVYHLERAKGR